MAQDGTIEAREYNAGLVVMARDYLGAARTDLAVSLLATMPAEYASEILPEQAVQDEDLLLAAEELAALLVSGGHVDRDVGQPVVMLSGVLGRA